ncbi:unnamed protein product [Rhodiola kirilowii]
MYEARAPGESYTNDVFIAGVKNFIETAMSKDFLASDNTIRCPCTKCKNRRFINIRKMEEHLYKYGFTPKCFNWTLHGEDLAETNKIWSHASFAEMFPDFASPNDIPQWSNFGEQQIQNVEVNRFFNLLNSSSEPAYKGCTTETELSINMKMLATKANYGFSEGAFNAMCGTMKILIGGGNKIPSSFKQSKKLLADLGMGYKRIDVCVGGCMIYYGYDKSMTVCHFCSKPRYHRPSRA